MSQHVLGAQLYTCRNFTKDIDGVRETLRKVAEIGYKGIQVSGFGPVDPEDVAQAAADNGLAVGGTHVAWKRFQEELDAVVEEHKMWGCSHAAIGGLPGEYKTVDGIKRFLDELGPIAEKLAAEGIDFSYHNHAQDMVHCEGKPWLMHLYEMADPRVLKAEIDTAWIAYGGGDPAQWVRMCAGREPLIHLKDLMVTPEREIMDTEVGNGNLNWAAILPEAQAGGVEWYLVEQESYCADEPFEALGISYRNLREMGLR